jgi:flagellar hook-associated protein 3 FlgL
MTVGFVSTNSMTTALRQSMLDLQTRLSLAQTELSSGRVADIGLTLGLYVNQDYAFGVRNADLESISQTNATVKARLDTTDSVLSNLAERAQAFLSTLVLAQNDGINAAALGTEASTNLATLISNLNTTVAGDYIFGGVNTAVAPMVDYFASPPSANKAAVDLAFLTEFGGSQSNAAVVSAITPAQMDTFLSGSFASLFSAGWNTDWSNASSQTAQVRISLSQTIAASVTANDPSVQKLVEAYTMVADLGLDNMNDSTATVVLQAATQLVSDAIADLTNLRASVGAMQKNVTAANETIAAQQQAMELQIGALENVDEYEVSVRINNLMTHIETSYSLTARIQRLSLSRYL